MAVGIWRGRKTVRRNQPPTQPDLTTNTTLNPSGPHSAVKHLTCINKPSPTSVGTPECTLPLTENFRWGIPERILHLSKGFTLLKLLIDWVWIGRGRRCISLFETGSRDSQRSSYNGGESLCLLFGVKPLIEPMLTCCQLNYFGQTFWLTHFVKGSSKLWADSRVAPIQWETSLQINTVCHWLGANLGSALKTDNGPILLRILASLCRIESAHTR